MQKPLAALALGAVALLSGCYDDAASFKIDGRYHALSVERSQPYFWSDVEFSVIVSRLPDCQRKYLAIVGSNPQAKIELWMLREQAFVLKQGKKMFVMETQSCQGAKLDQEPEGGLGKKLGVFKEKDGFFVFLPDDKSAPAAPAAAPTAEAAPAPAAPEAPATPSNVVTQPAAAPSVR